MKAEIVVKRIEEDGTITFETGKIPTEHHQTAEEFFKTVAKLMGGEVITEKLNEVHVHHDHNSKQVSSQQVSQ
jgi:hypothetical protein